MVQRDIITFIIVISILLFVLSGIVCFCYILPVIYECIRKREKIKPLTEIKKINPLQIVIV